MSTLIYHWAVARNMRLTPSWLHASADGSTEEPSGDSQRDSGVTMVHAPAADLSTADIDIEDDGRAATFLPESDAELLGVLDEMNTPVTVDQLTDTLIEPARPSIETWATVHEHLHQNRLPALDATGAVDFDETTCVVERSTPPGADSRFSGSLLAALSVGFLLAAIGLVSMSVLLS